MLRGRTLRSLRTRRGLTLKALGELSGLSGDDIARYERGEVQPRRENTEKLSAALGVPISCIRDGLCWTDSESPEPWESGTGSDLLRQEVLRLLEETYGTVRPLVFYDRRGTPRGSYLIGSPPDSFTLSEADLASLEEAVTTVAVPLARHMMDPRPEKEAVRDILQTLQDGPPPTGEDRCDLTDAQWEQVKDLLPPEKSGRGRAFKDNRLMLNGILYWLQTGVPWKDLPPRFGRSRCVYDRLRRWNDSGIWTEVLARLLERGILREEAIVVDSTHFNK